MSACNKVSCSITNGRWFTEGLHGPHMCTSFPSNPYLLSQIYFKRCRFSSNLFSSHTLAWACILQFKIFLMLVSLILYGKNFGNKVWQIRSVGTLVENGYMNYSRNVMEYSIIGKKLGKLIYFPKFAKVFKPGLRRQKAGMYLVSQNWSYADR